MITKLANLRAPSLFLLVIAIAITPRIPIPISLPGRSLEVRADDFIIFILFTISIIPIIKGIIFNKQTHRIYFSPLFLWIAIVFGVTLIATLIGMILESSGLYRAVFFLIYDLSNIAFFLLIINWVKTVRIARALTIAIIIGGFLNLLWVMVQFLVLNQGYPLFVLSHSADMWINPNRISLYGTSMIGEFSPFGIGIYFCFVTLLTIGLFIGNKKASMRLKLLYALLGLGFATCALLSGIKLAAICLAIGSVTLLLIWGRGTKLLLWIGIVVIVGFGILQAVADESKFAISRITHLSGYVGAMENRIPGWVDLIEYGLTRPLTGSGRGIAFIPKTSQYGQLYTETEILWDKRRFDYHSSEVPNSPFGEAHNQYVRIFLETGILGLVAFSGFIVSAFIISRKIFKSSNNDLSKVLSSVFIACLIALLIASITQDAFNPALISRMFWLYCGLSISSHHLNKTIQQGS